EGLLQLPSDK
nr:RecName: Full=L-ascorbate peroxidase, cytosolic [Pseudotsuga menziesii]